jgi:hypothetical protein
LHDFDGDSFTSIAPWLSMRVGASGWMPYSTLSFQPVVSVVVSSIYAWYCIGEYRLLKLYHYLLYKILSYFIILQFYILIWNTGLYLRVQ